MSLGETYTYDKGLCPEREGARTGILRGVIEGNLRGRVAYLIVNPAANGGRAARRRLEIEEYLKGKGVAFEWHETRGPGDARGIVGSFPDGSLVVAVGGDGTVHEVAAACAGTEKVLGVLPVGSGNDYVKALGMGTRLSGALDHLVGGAVRRVDMGEVNGRLFNNGLGIGADAEVAAGALKAPKALVGHGGYLWAVGRLVLRGLRMHGAGLRLGGSGEYRSRTALVAVALGTTYGGGFTISPEARLDDGLFDVVWTEELGVVEVLGLVSALLRGAHLSHPKVHFARAAEVEVTLDEPAPAHVDGELLEPARHFRARVLPKALHVIAPQEAKGADR